MPETMNDEKMKIFLMGKLPDDFAFWKKMLSADPNEDLEFIPLEKITDVGYPRGKNVPDLILLDLSRNGVDPIQVFLNVHNSFPIVPTLLILNRDDPDLALQLISEGAQDCLVKDRLNPAALVRITHYALARQKFIQQLRTFSLIDELTGLYNRRGFLALAQQQLKLANRTGQILLLAFIDVDGLKTINDFLGHQRGDLALIEMAHILKEAFRETDILARLGGDEFVALLVCAEDLRPEILSHKFELTMEEHNSYGKSGYRLSASIGIAQSDPGSSVSIEALLEKADQLMYKQKILSRSNKTSLQLRFLKSVPLHDWLKRTSSLLEPMIPIQAWPKTPPSTRSRILKIYQNLSAGLLTFVTKRSLCGTNIICDLGCTPSPGNQSPDRFEECVISGPTEQYLVEGVQNQAEMAELLAGAVFRPLIVDESVKMKIRNVLQNALSEHLYQNTKCHRVSLCEHSQLVNLKWELQHPHSSKKNPQSIVTQGEDASIRVQEESRNLESFFDKNYGEWERRAAEKFQPLKTESGTLPHYQKSLLRRKKILELVKVIKDFMTFK